MKLKDFEIVKKSPPHDKCIWVKVLVKIKKNKTGEIVDYYNDSTIWDNGINFFIWEEGNYSCDCNRELFFERAKGNEPDSDNVKCGTGGFSVNIYCPKTNECLYKEFKEE